MNNNKRANKKKELGRVIFVCSLYRDCSIGISMYSGAPASDKTRLHRP